jgi:3'-5' exoribonuclease
MGSVSQRRTVAELQPGERIEDQVFRIQQKDLRTTTNGGLYIHMVLADGTGQILARMWSATQELFDSLPEGGLSYVRGRVENYKGNKQFIVDGVRAVEPGAFQPADFLPRSRHDTDALWDEVKGLLRTIEDRDLLALVGRFVNDAEFARDFRRAPAAITFHHAYLGGLVEHTRNLLRLAHVVCPLYPQVSRDLVLAGVFLHDAGKVRELRYDANFEYTPEGQLLGHIVQAVLWVREKVRELEAETGRPFPTDIELGVQHLIVSHHGKYEFGSPKLPAIAEAIIVHHLDNLDAKVNMVFEAIAQDNDPNSPWTGFIKALETKVYKRPLVPPASGSAARPE